MVAYSASGPWNHKRGVREYGLYYVYTVCVAMELGRYRIRSLPIYSSSMKIKIMDPRNIMKS